ncbi:MAG: ATPase domain-containing protein [Stellaceae bacterium]
MSTKDLLSRASTGVTGLDHGLCGGLACNRLHLLEGSPGAGRSTVALQFLRAGGRSPLIGAQA